MAYVWTPWEGMTYRWPEWTRRFGVAPQRWRNPHCDALDRPLDTTVVQASEVPEWPDGWADAPLLIEAGTEPWEGQAGGIPMQMVDPDRRRPFVREAYWNPGVRQTVEIPVPMRDSWGHEGYPDPHPRWGSADGDRHWIGVEPDGTSHEVFAMYGAQGRVGNYCRWSPDGEIEFSTAPEGGVNKAGVRYSDKILGPADPPHRLLIVLAGRDEDPETWTRFPRVGDVVRLSAEAHARHMATADLQQRLVLDSLHIHGAVCHDHGTHLAAGGRVMHVGTGLWAGNTLSRLDIRMGDLEEVLR